MTTPVTEETPAPSGEEATKPATLEETLADLPEDRRKFVLDQVAKARTEAKGLRDRLKAAEPKVAQFDALEQASKTAEERSQEALQAAEQRASAAAQRIARAEVKAALSGVIDDPEGLIDDLNLGKFIDADGDIDADAIAALRAKYVALGGGTRRPPRPDFSQASGATGSTTASPASDFADFIRRQLPGGS